MVDVEKGFWVEDAVPIQQICFAQGDNRASFLAVRLPMKTRIFRPVYHDRRKSAVRSPLYELPSSRIDPHPILSISPDQTGGAPHADVTFNPDYQRQFGIVDQKGNWSIWDIDGGSRRVSKYTASCTILGPLRGSQDGIENTEPMTQEDGWARILWVGDVNTVVVCNRRELKVFDISGNQFTALKSPELMAEHAADWILDVKKHPLYAHRFFVLTSTHLFLAVVTCKKDVLGNSDMEPGARILLSWTHFRGLEDITLQLCTPVLSSEGTYL
jgi:RNA polymerase I-specific transcription initiation factor RRN6